jgi:hypothetical protein
LLIKTLKFTLFLIMKHIYFYLLFTNSFFFYKIEIRPTIMMQINEAP